MREKVKIFTQFSGDQFEELEDLINDWFEGVSNLRITSRTMSTSAGTDIHGFSFANCTVCIFYEGGD